MDNTELLKLLGTGGISLVALLVLARLVLRIGERMIVAQDKMVTAIEKIGEKVDDHTKADVAAQGEVAERIARLEGKIDESLNWSRPTPVEDLRGAHRAATPIGSYRLGRGEKP